jgi:penicillin amidase
MRQIVDLSDLSATLMIHTTGESGHPGNAHYDDFIDPWRFIQYHPALWDRPSIESDAESHLTLAPPG